MSELHKKIAAVRVALQQSRIKKSGKNNHAGFSYYELADFLPRLNELMNEHGLNDVFTIEEDSAVLSVVCGNERQEYRIPFQMFDVPTTKGGFPMMQQIQYLGALNTYYKRYLYLNAFGITDGEVIDAIDNRNIELPRPTAVQFKKIFEKHEQGKVDLETIQKSFKLNSEQLNKLQS